MPDELVPRTVAELCRHVNRCLVSGRSPEEWASVPCHEGTHGTAAVVHPPRGLAALGTIHP